MPISPPGLDRVRTAIDLFALLIRWGLGLAFIYAGASKALDVSGFASVISDYGLLPELLLMPAALFLIAIEVVAGVGLILKYTWALHITAALLLLFVAILTYGLWLGLDVDCGCFGPEDPEGAHHSGAESAIFRDIVMLLGVAVLYLQQSYIKSRGQPDGQAE